MIIVEFIFYTYNSFIVLLSKFIFVNLFDYCDTLFIHYSIYIHILNFVIYYFQFLFCNLLITVRCVSTFIIIMYLQ